MSHAVTMGGITSLAALKRAAAKLGLSVREDRHWKWYGQHVGDYKLPEGFQAQEIGHCAEMVLYREGELDMYEIGVAPARNADGSTVPGEYCLLYDFWDGGRGMDRFVGDPVERNGRMVAAPRLLQAYHMEADLMTAQALGHRVLPAVRNADGSVTMTILTDPLNADAGIAAAYDTDGGVRFEVNGYAGQSCLAATVGYELGHGRPENRVHKPEMFVEAQAVHVQAG